ncbi:MAG: hypothetical protein FWF94_05540 [Oscillospiraceae bacterium]|nr:hypothetical protein [Oscillospiraceae bacterium]
MKKLLIVPIILVALCLSACGTQNELNKTDNYIHPEKIVQMSVEYYNFEEAIAESTDVVIAKYIDNRPFGDNLTEYEFIIIDRVLGNAAEKIFVYAENIDVSVLGGDIGSYKRNDVSFDKDAEYLLPLIKIWQVTANTHEDGYLFIGNLVIDLNNPSKSLMYNEPINAHSKELNFNESLSKNQVLS